MLAGPIFRVEMVSAARRDRYFWLRVLYAAIILFVLWTVYLNVSVSATRSGQEFGASIRERAQAAAYFFVAFSWVQLIGLLAVAPAMAVGTIATERERRTIEYLFATDLSNSEIVLGKTIAKLLLVCKFAVVSLPILLLFRLLGGIPADLVAASFLIAGSTAVVLTALSVCVSVWSKRVRDASIRVYLVLAALLALPPLGGTVFRFALANSSWWSYFEPAVDFLNDINPLVVLARSMGPATGLGAGFNFQPVLTMAAWHAAIAAGLVALSTLAVRRVHLREASRGGPAKTRRWGRPVLPRFRPGLGDEPVLWKEAFAATAKTKLGFIGFVAVAALGLAALAAIFYAYSEILEGTYGYTTPGRQYAEFLAGFTGLVGTGVLLLVAARASGLVTVEKERDCWISLISTPLSGGDVIRGKTLGNLYAARWGIALVLLAWALGITFDATIGLATLGMLLSLVLCSWFLTLLGLTYSLRSATSLRSLGFTLTVGVLVGGGYLFCCCPVIAASGNPDETVMVGMAPCMPFLLLYPAMAYATQNWGPRSEMVQLTIAYCLGLVGYLVACVVMTTYLVQEFDALAGRGAGTPDGRTGSLGS